MCNFRRRYLLGRIALAIVCLGLAISPSNAQDTVPQPEKDAAGGRKMRVQVVDVKKSPLAGATVHVGVWTNEPFKKTRDYQCDEKGWATIELPKRFYILRLWGIEKQHVTMFANWNVPDHDFEGDLQVPAEHVFRLPKGQTIGGFVKNEAGEPIKGARVEVLQSNAPEADEKGSARPIIWFTGDDYPLTDDEGKWKLDNVPPGDHVEVFVKLTHKDYVSDFTWATHQRRQRVEIKAFRDRTAVIVMPRGARVSGVVLDPDDKPIAGALLAWGDRPYFTLGSQTLTDEKGRYEFPPLPPGETVFTVMAPNFAPDSVKVTLGTEDTEVNFPVRAGKQIQLRFVDEDGRALPGVYVGIERWRPGAGLFNQKNPNSKIEPTIPWRANDAGVFDWAWAPDDVVTFGFHKQGFNSLENQKIAPESGEQVIKMVRTKR